MDIANILKKTFPDYIHVAVGVIFRNNQILISRRKKEVHQGGKWEFPGGKIEDNESILSALDRELFEELDIHIEEAHPLITIPFEYDDVNVLLCVYQINQISGVATGKEGQDIRWINIEDLSNYRFPKANLAIINAIKLPQIYAITPDFNRPLQNLESLFQKEIKLLQIRTPVDEQSAFSLLEKIEEILILAKKYQVNIQINSAFNKQMINSQFDAYKQLLDKYQSSSFLIGLHYTSTDLYNEKESSNLCHGLKSASCHHAKDIQQANHCKLDFIVLSPIKKTTSHLKAIPLGWETFESLSWHSKIPVYALGGMDKKDTLEAKQRGAQGIAGISLLEKDNH